MLFLSDGQAPRRVMDPSEPAGAGFVWVDLLNASEAEQDWAARATGLRVPSLAELSEIERSSRLATEHGALYLSTPMSYLDAEGISRAAPLGIVLSAHYLMTVRFAEMPAFDSFAERFQGSASPACSVDAFLGLLEAITDRLADVLEYVGNDLDGISRRVFRPQKAQARRADLQLQATLREVGRLGQRLSNIRDGLLGVQRIVGYTSEIAAGWIPADQMPRLVVLRQDIGSLSEHDTRLSEKVQFLLDATLGFINIEQNNGIKILTVVSVVGVPPTLVASIYGMNFKIPELQWEYGYAYGLSVIVLSAVVPLIWFRRRGWI